MAGKLKEKVKAGIKKSDRAKRYIKKLYEAAKYEESVVNGVANANRKTTATGKKSSAPKASYYTDVIYPKVQDTLYNKRIHNYMLETHYGASIRRWVIEQMAYKVTGRFPDLDNPKGFNEKMQWMRFHYHDPLMTKCVDKCSFKDYIREVAGEKYVVPLYGVWENVNDIDFDSLPDSFALKSTWGWGDLQNILVKNKKSLNYHHAKALLADWMQPWNNYYYQSFEWDSKDIKPRCIAEELLQPACGEIIDYKFYCYNGVCKHFLVCKDRKTKTKYINYDLNFNCIKLSPNSYVEKAPFEKPDTFDEMLSVAEKLAKPFPLVRVDFYDVDGKLYVGEMTFSPGGGFNTYYDEWDRKLGDFLTLPEPNVPEDEI